MTEPLAAGKPTKSNDTTYDDLTRIKFIGPALQQWLRESLNVHTYADLASLTAEEIESHLKAAGRIADRRKIEGWITEAGELAAAQVREQPAARSARPESGQEANSETRKDGWQPFASFVVEFQARPVDAADEWQTAVHHIEEDVGEQFPGLAPPEVCRWMIAQLPEAEDQRVAPDAVTAPPEETALVEELTPAEEPAPVEETVTVGETAPIEAVLAREETQGEAQQAKVEITHIQAFQTSQTETSAGAPEAGRTLPTHIESTSPFALEVAFMIVHTDTEIITRDRLTYRAQFHVRDLATGAIRHLGNSKPYPLEAEEGAYTALLAEATLQPGIYLLGVLVMLQSRPPLADYREIPLLQVV